MGKSSEGKAPVDIDKALLDPGAVFDSPGEIVEHDGLTAAQKTEILRRWYYDEAEVDVAGEEGMPGADDNVLAGRILQALEQLDVDTDFDSAGPSKQHGLSSRTKR